MFRGARASGDVRGPITQRAARRGSGFAGASPAPPLAAGRLSLSALAAPEVGASLLLPAGGSPASPHPPLSPSLPSLPILGFSIISQCDGHLSGLRPLSVRGVGPPSLFQRLLRPHELSGPGSRSPRLRLALSSFVSGSTLRPPPASASGGFPPCLCASVSPGDRRSPSGPRASGAPLGASPDPGLSRAFHLPRRARGSAKHPPLPKVTMKSPCDPGSPSYSPQEPGLRPQSPRRPLGSPRTPPPPEHTHTHTRAVDGVQLQLHCAKGAQKGAGLEIRESKLWLGQGPGKTFLPPAAASGRHAPWVTQTPGRAEGRGSQASRS